MKKIILLMAFVASVSAAHAGDSLMFTHEKQWIAIRDIARICVRGDSLFIASDLNDEVLEVGITHRKPKFQIREGLFIPPCKIKVELLGKSTKLILRFVTKRGIQKVTLYINAVVAESGCYFFYDIFLSISASLSAIYCLSAALLKK